MRAYIVIAAGLIMVLSSAAHAFLGWPALTMELAKSGVAEDLSGALSLGWYFGSVSMLAFGIITVSFGLRFKRGDRSGAAAIAVIAAGYSLFGALAIVMRGFNPHFLLFIATGLLAGLPLLGAQRN